MAWQIPLLGQLRADGVPIEGLTIGAGVPSIEIANEYITTLGIKHIAFKPGSVEAIQAVINVANANPTFPVILQVCSIPLPLSLPRTVSSCSRASGGLGPWVLNQKKHCKSQIRDHVISFIFNYFTNVPR